MLKNLLLGILTLTTVYLGWIAFPSLRPVQSAHAEAFVSTNAPKDLTMGNNLSLKYTSCGWREAGGGNPSKVEVSDKGDKISGFFKITEGGAYCNNNEVAAGIWTRVDNSASGDKNVATVRTFVYCCTFNLTVSGLHN